VKKCWVFFIMFLFFFPCHGMAQEDYIGIIKTMSGKVYVQRDDRRIIAVPKMSLSAKDTVVTGHSGYAGILFTDGTVITLGTRAEFRIDTYIFAPEDDAYYFSFFLEQGSAIYNSGKIGKLSPQSVKLSTPKATVGIRGTRFIVDLN